MKKVLVCKKDWEINGVTHFKEGEQYNGTYKENSVRKGINSFGVKDKNGKVINFHSGSDYFDISFSE